MIPIAKLREMIEGESDDARYTAWLELYSSPNEEAKKEMERIVTASDPILKILLLRFLSHISEERALFILRDLLSDPNSVVVESAEKAFERNKYQRKVYALVPLIHSPNAKTRDYAMEQLSLGGIVEIVDPLLRMMENADVELLLKILNALRHLAEKRLIPLLAPYLKDSRVAVRYKTVLIFGTLYEGGHHSARPFLLKLLKDPEASIRQAVLWCLRKRPDIKDLPLLFEISVHDSDPYVRQEALLELTSFPTSGVIHHLLKILATEKERLVLLKGEGVLLSMPESALVTGLRSAINKGGGKADRKSPCLVG